MGEKSNNFNFTSYSSKDQSDLLPILGLKKNSGDTTFYETLVIEKENNEILKIKKAELRIDNDLTINISGDYSLAKGYFNNGFINVKMSDEMYLSIKEQGFKISEKDKKI